MSSWNRRRWPTSAHFTERLDKILLEVTKATLSAEKSALSAAELLLCIREWIRDDQ